MGYVTNSLSEPLNQRNDAYMNDYIKLYWAVRAIGSDGYSVLFQRGDFLGS